MATRRPCESRRAASACTATGWSIRSGYGEDQFPSDWRKAFGTREEARRTGVADLIEHIGRRPADRRQAELLRGSGASVTSGRCSTAFHPSWRSGRVADRAQRESESEVSDVFLFGGD